MQSFSMIGRMALEIPVASKLGTPRYLFSSLMQLGEPQSVAIHISGPVLKI